MVGNRPSNPGKLLEGILEGPATTRNWNTSERIVANYPVIERGQARPHPRRRG
jgi:hypothetical protein